MVRLARWGLLAALVASLAIPASARLFRGGSGVGGGGGPYTYVCSLITCTYSFSLTHSLVSGASTAYTLTNVTASTTQAIGFDTSHNVNATTIKTFCASSSDCRMASIADQGGTICVPFNATVGSQPLLTWWPATNTPIYIDTNDSPSGGNIFQILSSESSGTNSNCGALAGAGAKSIVWVFQDAFSSTLGANAGLVTDIFGTPSGPGTLIGGYNGNPGSPFCGSSYCVGLDDQLGNTGPFPLYSSTQTNAIHVGVATFDGGSPGSICVYLDGTQLGCNSPAFAIATESNMSLGWASNGSGQVLDWVMTANALNGTQVTNVTNTLASYYSGRSPGPALPGDMILPFGSNVPQQSFMAAGWSASYQQTANYFGPGINVCQGTTATCEDIGFIAGTGLLDVATANSFCGPSNCRVQRAYNQGIALGFHNTNTHDNANQDMVAPTTAERPSLTFNCDGAGVPCMTGNGSEWLCSTANNAINQPLATVTIVAERTGNFSAMASALGSGSNQNFLLGFAAGANEAFFAAWQFSATILTVTSVADSTAHSMTTPVDGTNLNTYVDGVFHTTTSVDGTNSPGGGVPAFCLFANTSAGANPLTGNIYEASIYGGANSGWNLEMSSGQVATLRTNQKSRIAGLP
jgi:hypothetical protein